MKVFVDLTRFAAQLAVLLGGHRVTAGLGAGWSAEEFDALGLEMPGFRTRTDRLAEVMGLARGLWTDGTVSHAGVRAAEEELCARWAGIPYRPVDRSPYLLFGSPAQMAEALAEWREAYGLERISLGEEGGITTAPSDPLRFCREVVPLLDRW